MVKRYELWDYNAEVETADGEWVRYEDVEQLESSLSERDAVIGVHEATIAELRAENERLREGLKRLVSSDVWRVAPCVLYGYNGPWYFQPETHPCAAEPIDDARVIANEWSGRADDAGRLSRAVLAAAAATTTNSAPSSSSLVVDDARVERAAERIRELCTQPIMSGPDSFRVARAVLATADAAPVPDERTARCTKALEYLEEWERTSPEPNWRRGDLIAILSGVPHKTGQPHE
ncbi:MAG: hypothetical protein PHX83_07040 [Acidobacteriia bacterium]|nr:hypothetical protein [Terriglobia bacterium]